MNARAASTSITGLVGWPQAIGVNQHRRLKPQANSAGVGMGPQQLAAGVELRERGPAAPCVLKAAEHGDSSGPTSTRGAHRMRAVPEGGGGRGHLAQPRAFAAARVGAGDIAHAQARRSSGHPVDGVLRLVAIGASVIEFNEASLSSFH